MNSLQDSIEYGLRKLGYDKIKDNLIVILSAGFLIWASTKKRYSDTTIQRYRNRNLELEPKPRIIYANYRTS